MINPKKELFKWGPIEFRLLYGSYFTEVCWLRSGKYYPWYWSPCLVSFEDGKVTFILEEAALRSVGEKYFRRYFLNKENYRKQWARWKQWMREWYLQEQRYETMNFSSLDAHGLLNAYKAFYDCVIRFWLITHVPEIANWGGEQLLKKVLARIDPTQVNAYLEILSAPVNFSFFQEEELDLLRIVKKKDFAAHAKKYHWILNSYGGNRILPPSYFEKKLRQMLKNGSASSQIKKIQEQRKKNIHRKKQLAAQLKLSNRVVTIANQLAQSIYWQDMRKAYIWRMHAVADRMLKAIARRTAWKFDDLLWCWPQEVIQLLQGGKVNTQKILSRKTRYIAFVANGRKREIYGQEAAKLQKKYMTSAEKIGNELCGLAVSKGKDAVVQGRVAVIRNPFKDGKKMKKGDVLVAGMTSPEFIVVMRKARAIITDHGGMTSHAAIVSRELGIPCIVGTKVATQVLKDGDRVEVNTDRGIVKKI